MLVFADGIQQQHPRILRRPLQGPVDLADTLRRCQGRAPGAQIRKQCQASGLQGQGVREITLRLLRLVEILDTTLDPLARLVLATIVPVRRRRLTRPPGSLVDLGL